MVQLRNIDMLPFHLPDPLPSDLVMQNLHTLGNVVNFKFSEEVCERIPNIKKLHLKYCDTKFEPLRSRSYYCFHNLGHFRKLESLHCSFTLDGHESEWRESGLSLELPSSLKKLTLHSCHLDWEELNRMAGSLPRLEWLDLGGISFTGSEWTLVDGNFPRLKFLLLIGCDDLVYWNADNSSFPALECLIISDSWKLDEISSRIVEIPTLQSIHLHECSDRGNENPKLKLSCEGVTWDQLERLTKMLEEEGLTTNIEDFHVVI